MRAEAARDLEPAVVDVDGDQRRDAVRHGRRDDEHADSPDADHDAARAGLDGGAACGVEGDGERLRHRRRLVGTACRYREADRRRRRHELRQAAVHVQPERRVLGAEVRATPTAMVAPAARDARAADDAVTGRELLDAGADRDHPAGELVTERDRRARKERAVLPLRRVGPADRAPRHREDDLVSSRRVGLGDRLDPDVSPSAVHRRLHRRRLG